MAKRSEKLAWVENRDGDALKIHAEEPKDEKQWQKLVEGTCKLTIMVARNADKIQYGCGHPGCQFATMIEYMHGLFAADNPAEYKRVTDSGMLTPATSAKVKH